MTRITHGPNLNSMMLGNGRKGHLVCNISDTLYSVILTYGQKRNKIALSLIIIFEIQLVNVCQIVALFRNAQGRGQATGDDLLGFALPSSHSFS